MLKSLTMSLGKSSLKIKDFFFLIEDWGKHAFFFKEQNILNDKTALKI
jgi:hypothetical protein